MESFQSLQSCYLEVKEVKDKLSRGLFFNPILITVSSDQ